MPPASKNKRRGNGAVVEGQNKNPNYAPPDNMELDRMLPPIGTVKKLKEWASSIVTNPKNSSSRAKLEALQSLEKKTKSEIPPFLMMKIQHKKALAHKKGQRKFLKRI